MNIEEIIKVMTAYSNGAEIEYTSNAVECWMTIEKPAWDWSLFSYKIKEKPKELLWFWKGEVSKGDWRFQNLMKTESEIKKLSYSNYVRLDMLGSQEQL